MSGRSHVFFFVFLFFVIVPCHYGQVSGVKVWLAKKLSGFKILKTKKHKSKFVSSSKLSV